jgi:hypothetical protein
MTSALIVRIGLSVVLVGLGLFDLWKGRVPNPVIVPLLLTSAALAGLRLWAGEIGLGQVGLMAGAWAACWLLWSLRVFGGGDMKLAMALIGLYPNDAMLLLLPTVSLVGLVAVWIAQEGEGGLRRLAALVVTVASGVPISRDEIQAAYTLRRSRVTFVLSLAGLLYIWLGMGGTGRVRAP